jgi:hypothetical protein
MSIRSLLVESSELCCTVGLEGRMRVLLLLTVLPISAVQSELIGFDQATPGKLPADWVVAMTHAGAPPRWEIVRDESAPSPPNVLAQLSRDRTAGRFPLAIWDQALFQNGELSVAFKTVDGAIDQAAGIVWRYQNANNYYIVRAKALENNVVFYKGRKRRSNVDCAERSTVPLLWSKAPHSEWPLEHAQSDLQRRQDRRFLKPGEPLRSRGRDISKTRQDWPLDKGR